MKTFKEFISEKTFRINKDVDYIYNKWYRKIPKLFKDEKFREIQSLINRYQGDSISSKELPSTISQTAYQIKPIMITIDSTKANHYNTINNLISLQIVSNNFLALLSNYPSHEELKSALNIQYKRYSNEYSESRLKATIDHELTHWLDDATHNKHITNKIDGITKVYDVDVKTKKMNDGLLDVNFTKMEIESQIAGIKQIKRTHRKQWDRMTFNDLISVYTSLYTTVKNNLNNKKELNKWYKEITKRMNREGLLGKRMVIFDRNKVV